MVDGRIRSIVPLFGGGTNYVQTLDRTLEYVASEEPSHDELIEWHREQFTNVESQASIERRLRYLQNLEFIQRASGRWQLDTAGHRYLPNQDREVLFDIMAERNVGLQSLLFELAARPMTIDEINEFLLSTNEVLGWDPSQTDMAKQRVNWLRSLALVEQRGDTYHVTSLGQQFVDEIQSIRTIWDEATSMNGTDSTSGYTASESQTTTRTRSLDPEFRAVVLDRYGSTCPLSAVDHPALLDVAHVLPWSEYPDYRADFGNVLPLSKTHHAAFDAELFTLDGDFRVRVHPEFDTESEHLQQTVINREGERISQAVQAKLDASYLETRNGTLDWY